MEDAQYCLFLFTCILYKHAATEANITVVILWHLCITLTRTLFYLKTFLVASYKQPIEHTIDELHATKPS